MVVCHGLSSYSVWVPFSWSRKRTVRNGCQPWCSKQYHLPTVFPLFCDLSLIFLVSPNLLPQFLLVCDSESVLLKSINPWKALFQLSELLLWNINKKFQKSTFLLLYNVRQSWSETDLTHWKAEPTHHNDSLNHPSYFLERVYGIPATQACIHLSPAWLGAKCLLRRFLE